MFSTVEAFSHAPEFLILSNSCKLGTFQTIGSVMQMLSNLDVELHIRIYMKFVSNAIITKFSVKVFHTIQLLLGKIFINDLQF